MRVNICRILPKGRGIGVVVEDVEAVVVVAHARGAGEGDAGVRDSGAGKSLIGVPPGDEAGVGADGVRVAARTSVMPLFAAEGAGVPGGTFVVSVGLIGTVALLTVP